MQHSTSIMDLADDRAQLHDMAAYYIDNASPSHLAQCVQALQQNQQDLSVQRQLLASFREAEQQPCTRVPSQDAISFGKLLKQ